MASPQISMTGYTHFEKIGAGGFSTVYRAKQTAMGRDVAIKVLHTDMTSAAERRTFERECHAIGLLSQHPNIVTVYSEGFTDSGRPAIVMELYGENYRERLDRVGPMSIVDTLSLGVKIAGALHAAHETGILHRDLKPHNIFVSHYGDPALGDFGISTIEDERSISAASGLSVAYAAPEALEDSNASVASDIYSLAATLHHLAAGAPPFASKQLRTTVRRILTEPPAPFARQDVPHAFVDVLHRAMSKDPGDRHTTAEDLADALRSVQASLGLDRTPIPLRRDGGVGDGGVGDGGVGDGSATELSGDRVPEETVRRQAVRRQAVDRRDGESERARVVPVTATPVTATRIEAGHADQSASERPTDGERTILRARPHDRIAPQRSSEQVADAGPSLARRRAALGLGVAAVIAVIVLAAALTRGSQDISTNSTAVRQTGDPTDDFLDPISAPTEIRIEPAGEGAMEISFEPVAGAEQYEVRPVGSSNAAAQPVTGPASPIRVELSVGDAPCWEVTALGAGGRFSTSDPVCAIEP